MALSCPELVPDSWLAPSQLTHPDDLWIKFEKFEFDNERTLVLPNPSSDPQFASYLDMGGGGFGPSIHPPGALPTPPHSPPTEHDLDDLVASIPEILESPSASPPSAISEILSDLEGMETASSPPRLEGTWGADWWGGALIPPIEASIKRDIMWGGGGTCTSTHTTHTNTTVTTTTPTVITQAVEVKKERQDSESSTEVYRDVIYPDDLSDDDDDDDLPDTPSCTDSDCDGDDPLWSPPHQKHHPVKHQVNTTSPAPTTPAPTTVSHQITTATTTTTPAVDIEHNYCEPNHHLHHHHHHTTGTITPSDTGEFVVMCGVLTSPFTFVYLFIFITFLVFLFLFFIFIYLLHLLPPPPPSSSSSSSIS
ncbi:hypothetical protein E2C01_086903 [Portunus trituberculatus]|uniref:Uncharacterized protein n=1 Tax=Portunus trituberculatus TaxID=210409 RepID=A0A5B7JBV6_PORTR|nr:hypothetical protein [Portunus trituberculatus]